MLASPTWEVAAFSASSAWLAHSGRASKSRAKSFTENQGRQKKHRADYLYSNWIQDPALRRDTGRELNKGESRNSLARAVFLHRLGEIRDRTYENQQHRASGLNLLVTAITLWNTRYLNRAIAALRETEDVPDHLLAHLSPLGWEHINLTGDYVWSPADEITENHDGYRPLRPALDPALLAA
jgi:hypothetical protein